MTRGLEKRTLDGAQAVLVDPAVMLAPLRCRATGSSVSRGALRVAEGRRGAGRGDGPALVSIVIVSVVVLAAAKAERLTP